MILHGSFDGLLRTLVGKLFPPGAPQSDKDKVIAATFISNARDAIKGDPADEAVLVGLLEDLLVFVARDHALAVGDERLLRSCQLHMARAFTTANRHKMLRAIASHALLDVAKPLLRHAQLANSSGSFGHYEAIDLQQVRNEICGF